MLEQASDTDNALGLLGMLTVPNKAVPICPNPLYFDPESMFVSKRDILIGVLKNQHEVLWC